MELQFQVITILIVILGGAHQDIGATQDGG